MICFPFLRQFGAHDVFFLGTPAYTWTCMAPLLSFSPSILRPWRFLPWSLCLHLKLHGASLDLFSVNLAPLTFSSLEPLLTLEPAWRPSRPFLRLRLWRFLPWSPCLTLALETAWRPSCHIDLTFFPSFFFLAPSFFPFFFLIPFFSSFFPLFSPLSFFPFPFFFLFRAPLVTPGGPGPQSPPQDTPLF